MGAIPTQKNYLFSFPHFVNKIKRDVEFRQSTHNVSEIGTECINTSLLCLFSGIQREAKTKVKKGFTVGKATRVGPTRLRRQRSPRI